MQKHKGLSFEFVVATLSLWVVFAASASPIPLYDIYHHRYAVTYNQLALTSVFYFVGAVSALLFMGRLSNYIGRKRLTAIVFVLSSFSCVTFILMESAIPLILGRLLLGIACGLASSGIAAYVVDSSPSNSEGLSSAIVSNSPMIGLTVGAMTSGVLVKFLPASLNLAYLVVLSGLGLCAGLLFFAKDSVESKPGLMASLKPNFYLPEQNKRAYPVAALTFVATWSFGGFLQAYGPSLTAEQLGSDDVLMAAIVFSSYLISGAVGATYSARLPASLAQRVGMVIFTVAVFGVVLSMKHTSLSMFLIASGVAGAAQGAVLTGSVQTLMRGAKSHERAGILSIIFATSYTGAAVPSFIAGQLSAYLNLYQLSLCYAALAIIVCTTTLFYAREPRLA